MKDKDTIRFYRFSSSTGNNLGFAILVFLWVVLLLVLKYYVLPRIPSPDSHAKPPAPVPSVQTPIPYTKPPAPVPFVQNRSKVLYSSSTSQTIQYYEKGGVKYIEAEVNGVPVEVIVDTGASHVSLDYATIQKLGISSFASKGIILTAGGPVYSYFFKCASVKVGTMEVKSIDCSYNPTSPANLLGNSFLSHFSYSFNEADKTVTFICNECELDTSVYGTIEVDGKKYLYTKSGQLVEVQ